MKCQRHCLGLPTPEEQQPIPEYVKTLRDQLAELTERVRSLEEANRFYHGGNSDDD